MACYSLSETRTTGKAARFYADGKRISREKFEMIKQMAFMYGTLDTFLTRAWPVENGGTKRTNYMTARWNN